MMESILYAIVGGALIGLASSWLLYAKGRIAGISGIVGGLIAKPDADTGWKFSFLIGLLAGGVALMFIFPQAVLPPVGRPLFMIAIAGLLVGYGTRLGNGCTSGHGICGLTRFSTRSLVATSMFMATGVISATLVGLL